MPAPHSPAPRFFAIVPAAGRSVRMGRPKLLLPWRGRTVLEHVLAAWQAADLAAVMVVVHPEDSEIARLVRDAGCEVVVPETAPAEMKTSIQLGLARLAASLSPAPQDAWLLAPADLPGLTPSSIRAVCAAHDPAAPQIIVPLVQPAEGPPRRGHPVLFPWLLADSVFALAPQEGVNALLGQHAVRELPLAEPQLLDDLDTPADYARLHPQG